MRGLCQEDGLFRLRFQVGPARVRNRGPQALTLGFRGILDSTMKSTIVTYADEFAEREIQELAKAAGYSVEAVVTQKQVAWRRKRTRNRGRAPSVGAQLCYASSTEIGTPFLSESMTTEVLVA